MFDEKLLWKGKQGAPLMVIYPGGTGSRRPSMRGFDVIAAHFWMRGFSCYVAEVGGQDGHPGQFSVQCALDESRETLGHLRALLRPTSLHLFGSCSGGTLATWLASEPPFPDTLVLYETLPTYSTEAKEEFIRRAGAAGVVLTPNFIDEYIDTAVATPDVPCSILLLCGDASTPSVITTREMRQLASSFTSASKLEMVTVKGADHNVTRGSALQPLAELLHVVERFVDRAMVGPANMEDPGCAGKEKVTL